jgi:hypothetical protein
LLRNEVITANDLARRDPRRRVVSIFVNAMPEQSSAIYYGLRTHQGLDLSSLGRDGVIERLRSTLSTEGIGK